jgi:hypothetical protein
MSKLTHHRSDPDNFREYYKNPTTGALYCWQAGTFYECTAEGEPSHPVNARSFEFDDPHAWLDRVVTEQQATSPIARMVAKLEPGDHVSELDEQQQQVDVVATLTLSLPTSWDADTISINLRSALMGAFSEHLPASIPDENGNPQSPVNFTFREEAEIYGNTEHEPGEGVDRPFFVAVPGFHNLLLVNAEDASDAAASAALDVCDAVTYGECAGEYKVYAFDPLGDAGKLLGTYNVDENGELID